MAVEVFIRNAVICYPHLWEMTQYLQNAPKYQCDLLIDPDSEAHLVLQKAFQQELAQAGKSEYAASIHPPWRAAGEVNGGRAGKGLAPRAELIGKLLVVAKDDKYQPVVKAQDGVTDIRKEDAGSIFSGCIVNAKIRLYWSDDNPGVYVGLNGIQLVDNINVTPVAAGREEVTFEPVANAPAPVASPPQSQTESGVPDWLQ